MSNETVPCEVIPSTPNALREFVGAKILLVLAALAELPTQSPGMGQTAHMDKLQSLLSAEATDTFNFNMKTCVVMKSNYEFSLTPAVVATGILPHYANFLASQIVNSLTHYTRHGSPIALRVTVDKDYFAVATIDWAYSMEGVDVT